MCFSNEIITKDVIVNRKNSGLYTAKGVMGCGRLLQADDSDGQCQLHVSILATKGLLGMQIIT